MSYSLQILKNNKKNINTSAMYYNSAISSSFSFDMINHIKYNNNILTLKQKNINLS